ncbi:hypothetical protein IAT40_000314 [Kwoniella sp. CBS 6097]
MGTSTACNVWKRWQESGAYTWYFRYLKLKLASDPKWIDKHAVRQQRPFAQRFTSTVNTSRSPSREKRPTLDKGQGRDTSDYIDNPYHRTSYIDLTRGRPESKRSFTESSIATSRDLTSRTVSSDIARYRQDSYRTEESIRVSSATSQPTHDRYRPDQSRGRHRSPSRSRARRRSASPDWAEYFARTRPYKSDQRPRAPRPRNISESSSQIPYSQHVYSSSSGSPMLYGNCGRESSVEVITPASPSAPARNLSLRLPPRVIPNDIINLVSDSDNEDDEIVYVGRISPQAWSPLPTRSASPLDAPHIPSPERRDHSRGGQADAPYDESLNLQRLKSNDFSGPLIRPTGEIEVEDAQSDHSFPPNAPRPDTPRLTPERLADASRTFGQISPYFMPDMFRDTTIRSHRLDALHRNLGLPPVHPQPEPEPMIVGDQIDAVIDQLIYSPLVISDGLQMEAHPPWQSLFFDDAIVTPDDDSPAIPLAAVPSESISDDGFEPMELDMDEETRGSLLFGCPANPAMGEDVCSERSLSAADSARSLRTCNGSHNTEKPGERPKWMNPEDRPQTPPLPAEDDDIVPLTPPTPASGFKRVLRRVHHASRPVTPPLPSSDFEQSST